MSVRRIPEHSEGEMRPASPASTSRPQVRVIFSTSRIVPGFEID
jgi:hypothetical protein